ncbi:MAG: hypothetical protein LBJ62_01705 [Bifidobacteriaceae bacterium]|jgi:hypothetical protein|nr:hypothetical protein [Bifidobacteriaceae bacterium]
MKQLSIARTLRGANPVATPNRLDQDGRELLVRFVHPSLLVDDAARTSSSHRWRWVVAGAAAVAAATAAVAFPLASSTPAEASLTTGVVLGVTGDETSDRPWAGSAIAELTAPDGTSRWVRAWSQAGDLVADPGEKLSYNQTPDGALNADGAASLLSYVPTIVAVDGDRDEVTVRITSDAAADAVLSSVATGQTGGQGKVKLLTTVLKRDGDVVFYVQTLSASSDEGRAALESLQIAPDGTWVDEAAAGSLASPADLLNALTEQDDPLAGLTPEEIQDLLDEGGIILVEEDGVVSAG